MLLVIEVLQGAVVSEDGERNTQQISVPILEHTDNGQKFFLVDQVV